MNTRTHMNLLSYIFNIIFLYQADVFKHELIKVNEYVKKKLFKA